jgi:hypothetical protein
LAPDERYLMEISGQASAHLAFSTEFALKVQIPAFSPMLRLACAARE